jgi:hypothetical protein
VTHHPAVGLVFLARSEGDRRAMAAPVVDDAPGILSPARRNSLRRGVAAAIADAVLPLDRAESPSPWHSTPEGTPS